MTKFRKKPIVIEAMQYRGPDLNNLDYALQFDDWILARQKDRKCRYVGDTFVIITREGNMEATPGDWIICGVKGELYPCKPNIFAMSYEEIHE